MTIKEILSKTLSKPFERHHGASGPAFSYPGPAYPPYPPPHNYHSPPLYHGPPAVFKHYSFSHSTKKSGGGASSAALSALTLLSFLFFLNILQQCLKDQMTSMTPQVMVMSSTRQDISRTQDVSRTQDISRTQDASRTQKSVAKEPEKVFTLVDTPQRVDVANVEGIRRTKVKIVKVDARGEPIRTETVFINAMADGNTGL